MRRGIIPELQGELHVFRDRQDAGQRVAEEGGAGQPRQPEGAVTRRAFLCSAGAAVATALGAPVLKRMAYRDRWREVKEGLWLKELPNGALVYRLIARPIDLPGVIINGPTQLRFYNH